MYYYALWSTERCEVLYASVYCEHSIDPPGNPEFKS